MIGREARGRYSDGFLPAVIDPEKLKELFGIVRLEARKAGRNPDAIEFSCMTESLQPDDLKMLADIGVTRVVIDPPGAQPDAVTRGLEKIQQELISRG